MPSSMARRHHFVPAFALAQFARPISRKGWISQLEVESGRITRTRPDDVAFAKDLYAYENTAGETSNSVEAFFSIVEKHAAPALAGLRDDPARLTPEEREVIAYFLVFQQSRTPGGLARVERTRQVVMEIEASLDLATPDAFRARFERSLGDKSPGELESLRLRMQRQLLEGRVTYEAPRRGAMRQIIETAHDLAKTIYSLDWMVLSAEGAEFVTSDNPVAMSDPTPTHPWSGNAWESSPSAISFYPLTPTRGLFMTPGDCGLSTAHSGPEQIRRLNLMTYGWAHRRILASRPEVVTRVREQALAHPEEVAKRRSPKQVVLTPAGPHAAAAAEEYTQKGWPSHLLATTSDGTVQPMHYVVLDLDTVEPGAAADAVTKIVAGL